MNFPARFAVGALLVASCFAARADAVLDSFIDQYVVRDATVSSATFATSSVGTTDAIGGVREIFVNRFSDGKPIAGPGGSCPSAPANPCGTDGNANLEVKAVVGGGEFAFSEDTGAVGTATLRYDGDAGSFGWGAAGSGLLADLNSLGNGFSFSYHADFVFEIAIEIWDTVGGVSYGLFQTQFTGFDGNGNRLFKNEVIGYNELLGDADFSKVSAIEIRFNSGEGLLPSLASVDLAFTAPNAVPEPGVLALLGLGFLAMGARRKSRK